jgi:hypothetical protein
MLNLEGPANRRNRNFYTYILIIVIGDDSESHSAVEWMMYSLGDVFERCSREVVLRSTLFALSPLT